MLVTAVAIVVDGDDDVDEEEDDDDGMGNAYGKGISVLDGDDADDRCCCSW